MPLSARAATEPSPAPNFLSHSRRVWIMGVLNATPDSFYAGARAAAPSEALALAEPMVREGADGMDIGGESTRPGSSEVPVQTELDRVLPVIEALKTRWPDLTLSIDTQKAAVARAALARGVGMVNDISALSHDPAMVEVVAEYRVPIVLMHMQGTPQTMQENPRYGDVLDEIKRFFEERLAFAVRHGVAENRLILDPGIGFGKTLEHNLTIMRRLSEFLTLGRPLLVGVSRKSLIGQLLAPSPQPSPYSRERVPKAGEGVLPPEERLEGSLAAALWAVQQGARGLRVHDVGATKKAVKVWEGIQPLL